MNVNTKYNLDQKVLDVATLEDLKLIFNEAKDKVKESTEEANQLYQRSVLLLTSSIAILTSIIAYIASHWELTANNIVLGAISAILWVVCNILKDNIKTKDYQANGTTPEHIAVVGMFTDLRTKQPEWYLTANLIESYNDRLTLNKIHNDKRSEKIKEAIEFIYFIPPICIVIYFVFSLFS